MQQHCRQNFPSTEWFNSNHFSFSIPFIVTHIHLHMVQVITVTAFNIYVYSLCGTQHEYISHPLVRHPIKMRIETRQRISFFFLFPALYTTKVLPLVPQSDPLIYSRLYVVRWTLFTEKSALTNHYHEHILAKSRMQYHEREKGKKLSNNNNNNNNHFQYTKFRLEKIKWITKRT